MDEIQNLIDNFGGRYNLLEDFAPKRLLQVALNNIHQFNEIAEDQFKRLQSSHSNNRYNGDFKNIVDKIIELRYHMNTMHSMSDGSQVYDDSYDGRGRRKSHFGFLDEIESEIENIRQAIIKNKYKDPNVLRKLNDCLDNIDNFDDYNVHKFYELTLQCNRQSTWYKKYGEKLLNILIDIHRLRKEARDNLNDNGFGFVSGTF
jgi:Mg2+ and Co2+ transporter CorA